MEELGEDGPQLHHEVAISLSIEECDLIVLVGEKASWMGSGLIEKGARENQVMAFAKAEDASSIVDDFEGAVLFKGSRRNKLEQLLPTWAVDERSTGGSFEC